MESNQNKILYQDQEIASFAQSTLVSRNITILGRRTSVRLEPEMWVALRDISKLERCSIHDICSLIYARKQANTSLTAGIRVFLMLYYRAAATQEGHLRAGHGDFAAMRRRAKFMTEDEELYKKRLLFEGEPSNLRRIG